MPGLSIPWGPLARVCLASIPIFAFYPLRSWADGVTGFLVSCLGMLVLFVAAVRVLHVLGDEEKKLLDASPWRALRLAGRVLSG